MISDLKEKLQHHKRTWAFLLAVLVAGVVFVADQLTKGWIEARVVQGMVVPITSHFNLVFHYNTGVTFGFLSDSGTINPNALSFLAVLVVSLLVYWLWSSAQQKYVGVGLALIIGGALGNIADRINYGGVRDFLDFHYNSWHWPAFNLADSCIVIGVGLIILETFLKPTR